MFAVPLINQNTANRYVPLLTSTTTALPAIAALRTPSTPGANAPRSQIGRPLSVICTTDAAAPMAGSLTAAVLPIGTVTLYENLARDALDTARAEASSVAPQLHDAAARPRGVSRVAAVDERFWQIETFLLSLQTAGAKSSDRHPIDPSAC